MIVFAHLFNDCSGSPRVLAEAIAVLTDGSGKARLYLGSDGSGCLTTPGIPVSRYWYRRTPYPILTFASYLLSQFVLMYRLFRARDIAPDALIYVNTLLPFGAAVYGRLTKRPVLYHLHEVRVGPNPLQRFLIGIARLTANRLLYVSAFHQSCLMIPKIPSEIVGNGLSRALAKRAAAACYCHRRAGNFTVLMLASLRDYKGIEEFICLAKRLEQRLDIRFVLVLNETETAVRHFRDVSGDRPNLKVFPRTSDPGPFYEGASLVLNLTRPDLSVETFGLTLLEAMSFGVPVIGPPVGGPAELVIDAEVGFQVDSRDDEVLTGRVLQLADDEGLCRRFSEAAYANAVRFSYQVFSENLRRAVIPLLSSIGSI